VPQLGDPFGGFRGLGLFKVPEFDFFAMYELVDQAREELTDRSVMEQASKFSKHVRE
jgi:hypothetical protein